MNSVFSVISRFFMNGNFVGDFFDPWVGSFELWLRAIEDTARLSGACGAGGGFFFAGAIEGCLSCWNGGRLCWDLCFLDAQTGSMNNTKTMKADVELSSKD